jgi:hypothetical protein
VIEIVFGWPARSVALAASLATVASLAAMGPGASPVSATAPDSGQWQALGTGLNGNARGMAVSPDDTLYVGGEFTTASGVTVNRMASWANETWSAMGTGTGTGTAVYKPTITPGGELFVSGGFSSINGVSARNAARWDGTTWSALGSGITGNVATVLALADDSVLYGGQFTAAGGTPANGLALWTGTGFSAAFGSIDDETVYGLGQLGNGDIVAGGTLTNMGGVPVRKVAQWHDDTWADMGGGVNSDVYAIAPKGADAVFVGGYLTTAGGATQSDVSTNKVGLWQDDTWTALGFGIGQNSDVVYDVFYDDTHGLLYATGLFRYACGSPACLVTDDTVPLSNVGVWDVAAARWRPLATATGQGINNTGNSVVASSDGRTVYVGGDFTSAGGVSGTNKIARWVWTAPDLTAISPDSGPRAGGTSVTIDGTNFIGVSRVLVNGNPAPFAWADDSTVTVTMPAGSGSASIAVEAVGGTTSTATYTYVGADPVTPVAAGAPTEVRALAADRSASVSWAAPSSPGSFPVSHYLATSTPGAHTCLVAAPALTCEVMGLSNGTAYTFTVKALTGAGWSAASSPSNAVVPRAQAKPTIVITGSRDGDRIAISGTTTGFGMGGELKPWIRPAGKAAFTQGVATILVGVDGTFEWGRRAGKRVSVYVQTPDRSVRSNTVTLPVRWMAPVDSRGRHLR